MQSPSRPELIDARHADGVVRATSRQAYRTDVLPAVLDAWRAEPDRLAEAILTALDSGFTAEVVAAAEHLGKIDVDRRRRTWIPALVFCRAGRFTRAEETIARGRELFGDCADFLYVDAEILINRHMRAKGEAAVAAALDADPNHSRALRRTVDHYNETAGADASLEAIAAMAARPNAWRARLLLSELRFRSGEIGEARRLAEEACACEPGDSIPGPLSALLVRQNDVAGLLELVLPRFDPSCHGTRCGVNLLYALLESGRSREGEALVAAIRTSEPGAFPKHLEFYERAFAAIEPDASNDPRASVALHRALAAYARHETQATRRAMVGKLLASVLLLPLQRPVVDVPILDLGLPERADLAIEAITAVDAAGASVTLVFTGAKPLAAWDERHRHRIPLDARELLEFVRSIGGCALVIDAAGPASLELSSEQIDALLDGGELPEGSSIAPFVVEPLRDGLPSGIVETAERVVRGAGAIEGFFFQMISERRGCCPAFAILFGADTSERVRRDAVVEAQDLIVWEGGRRKKRIQVLPLSEGPLAEYLRFCAIRVK
ncbi:MAG: SseB family protein [Thermoanaerobaculia bacterium]